MTSLCLTLSSLALVALVDCATAPALQGAQLAPAQQKPQGLARADTVANSDHTTQHLDEGKTLVHLASSLVGVK